MKVPDRANTADDAGVHKADSKREKLLTMLADAWYRAAEVRAAPNR